MPSFDVTSEIDWQELDNAVNQARKELANRFDFRGVRCEINYDKKSKTLSLECSEEGKLDSLVDVLQNKLVKRGISLLSLDFQKVEPATGQSVRQLVKVTSGISKDQGKEITAYIKGGKFKVQAQIQDEQVRVTGKSRDILQEVISHLKQGQDKLKLPLQFGNFRD